MKWEGSQVTGPWSRSLGALLVSSDFQVRRFGSSGLVDRPYNLLYVSTVSMYVYMDRRSRYMFPRGTKAHWVNPYFFQSLHVSYSSKIICWFINIIFRKRNILSRYIVIKVCLTVKSVKSIWFFLEVLVVTVSWFKTGAEIREGPGGTKDHRVNTWWLFVYFSNIIIKISGYHHFKGYKLSSGCQKKWRCCSGVLLSLHGKKNQKI